ncbi:hypothetical protein BCR33DRAFT_699055 [Rhizoclosmatium globosum]|uniref:Glycosyl transferase CAP10 domain-containing protein n=1 Tax=Rhizoclosmatium globosum TaxID=329046 RepID=A0A1Y2C3W2_9FUNG|nr:hypothetical protein BCR33DRAFT_699055 [Rhizoclosmatium globosum]|eukprot:ORY41691.1 hypothetical protein BCR33DRAFT_699055 [Rhizoclosmatium globosum]
MDEPISLPSTDAFTSPYSNVNDTFKHNSCLREQFDTKVGNETTTRMAHGFLLAPASFITQNLYVPVLGMTKVECFRDIMVPGRSSHVPITKRGRVVDPIAWEDKKNVLFWRGSTTGGKYGTWGNPPAPWYGFHRIRLVEWAKQFSLKYPDRVLDVGTHDSSSPGGKYQVDIGFSGTTQCDPDECEKIKQLYPMKAMVKFEQTKQYKYLIVVDGNAWPNRLQTYLETNSVILFNGIFIDWVIWQLKPWVHYVPVKPDFSDLEEVMDWLQKHDDEAKKINENAKASCDNKLRCSRCSVIRVTSCGICQFIHRVIKAVKQ